MDIHIDLAHGCALTCPKCGSEGRVFRTEVETWYHNNFFHYMTYLHARMPRIECCDGILPVERPWLRAGTRFSPLGVDRGFCAAESAEQPYGNGAFDNIKYEAH
jgi:hypothetical protein